jgi:hypothetical protein
MALDYKLFLQHVVETMGKFAAERRALITILIDAGVTDWETQLEELRKTPQYQTIALRYPLLLKQAEVEANFEPLALLMQELNRDKLKN